VTSRRFASTRDEEEFSRAEDLYQTGDWFDALDGFAVLLARRLEEGTDLTFGDQVAAERLADLALMCGQSEAARSILAGLVTLSQRREDALLTDYFVLKLADAAVAVADFHAAEAAVRTMELRIGPLEDVPTEPADLATWEARCEWAGRREPDRPLLFSRLYLALGGWLAGNGFYRHAAVLLDRGAAHAQSPSSALACRAWVRLRLAFAAANLEQGALGEAESALQELRPTFDVQRHPGWWTEWLGLSGHLALLRGQFGAALAHLDAVINVCTTGHFVDAAVTALLHQARVLISVNQVLAAEDALAKADRLAVAIRDRATTVRIEWLRRLARDRGESPLGDGQFHSVAALWHGNVGPGPGRPLQESTVDPLTLPPASNYLAFFEDRALAVRWRVAKCRLQEASSLLAQLRKVYATTDSLLIRLRLDMLTGLLAYAAADYPTSERVITEVVPYVEQIGLKPELRDALRLLWWCGHREPAAPGTGSQLSDRVVDEVRNPVTDALGLRIQKLTDELSDTFPAAQRAIYLLDKWRDDERVLAGQIAEWERERMAAEHAPWWCRFWRRRVVRRKLLRLIEVTNRHRTREAESAVGITTENRPADRARRMPTDQVTLVFLVLPDFTFVARMSRGVLDGRILPLTRVRVRELTARWHSLVAENRSADSGPIADELAGALRLAELVGDLPRRVSRLALVMDDALHGFPFAAIRTGGSNGQYLIERFALSYRHESFCDDRQKRSVRSALVAAIPTGAAPCDEFPRGIPALPNTKVELEQIADVLATVHLPVGRCLSPELDAEELLAAWTTADLVHVACHGVFTPDAPDHSGLVIVGCRGIERISIRRLLSADLHDVKHITLSCCWGADNFVLPGRRILSLPEVIRRAGAGSVLAPLWEVDDSAAREFACRFHRYALTYPLDAALQRSQCDFINGNVPREASGLSSTYSHPYFWAGYRLLGQC
jgi:hypothetical protein